MADINLLLNYSYILSVTM